ncbi:MAG TPA: NeuD/PglB/VioB family sugar acetyltransferase [bacterium]|nr:NeuD/PglB/VioB family sugar acetyltransferase [bacterium]
MKDLVILGGGVHAAEMVEIVGRINQDKKTWNLLGLIGRKNEDVGKLFNQTPVLGVFEKMPRFKRNVYFAAANHNKLPERISVPFSQLISLVDPSAFVSRTAVIGKGCVIYPGCFIGLQVKLGDFIFILSNSVINHDVVLENKVLVNSGVTLAGGVHVGKNSYLGQACTIRERLKIGRESLVGMGAVVIKNVPPHSVMIGNPAREMRKRER